jgi:hypothetical protein
MAIKDLGIYPFQDSEGNDRLFLARFELPNYKEDFQISKSAWRALALLEGEEAPPAGPEDAPVGFIHFLAGFPIDTVEMIMIIGEESSKSDSKTGDAKVAVQPGAGRATAPVWKGGSVIFEWPDPTKLCLNKTALKEFGALFFATNLPGEPKPSKPHWWFRMELLGGEYIVPGEFLALGVRMMPGEYWGKQKSSPFIYSGNYMDTVCFTAGKITEVIEPTDDVPFPTYKVKWHNNEITINPTDFAEYRVGDRVTILKDVGTEKKSQLWKDDDMKIECDKGTWAICPVTFYGLEKNKEE